MSVKFNVNSLSFPQVCDLIDLFHELADEGVSGANQVLSNLQAEIRKRNASSSADMAAAYRKMPAPEFVSLDEFTFRFRSVD